MSEKREDWLAAGEKRLYAVLAEMTARGETGALATVIGTRRSAPRHSGAKMVVRADGRVVGSVGGGPVEARALALAAEVIADGTCRRLSLDLTGEAGVCGGETEIFIEPVGIAWPVWLFGAGHVGRAILAAARDLPLRFTVVDDRPDFLRDLPAAETLALPPGEEVAALVPGPRTLALLCSRSHELDAEYLDRLLEAERRAERRLAWIGMVGSRSKAAHLARRYADDEAAAARFAQVRIPVGLAIGAETPAEIALSVLAEMMAEIRRAPWLIDDRGRRLGLFHMASRPASPAGRREAGNPSSEA